MNFLNRVSQWVKISGKAPFLSGVLVLALALLASAVAGMFFEPFAAAAAGALISLGAAIALVYGYLNLARYTAENEIHKEQLETLIENLEDAIIAYDSDFSITNINGTAEELLGLSKSEIIGKRIEPNDINIQNLKTLAQIIFPSLAPSATQVSQADAARPQTTDIILENPHRELRTTLHRVLNEQKKVVSFLKVVRNKTREREVLQLKSDFINVAAHQLRTPLTAIGWSIESLQRQLQDADQNVQNLLNETLQLAQRTLKITNDLLDVSKIEEGKYGYVFEETDLGVIVAEIVKTADPIAQERGVTLSFDRPRAPLVVRMDKSKISTALLNIVDNAIRYNTKNGEVIIALAQTKQGGENMIALTVKDTGIGIPKEDQGKIFEKLYRGSNVAQLEPNGSGLGLFITKNIVEAHKGDIAISSIPKRGTTVRVLLPLSQKNN